MSDPTPGTATSGATPEAATPAPARFDTLPLDEKLLRAVADSGYQTMTPIQAKAIPIVLAGRDVMGAAQTGTGKTAAFSIPLLQKMLKHENPSMSPARHPVRALVLAPTRELADQVANNVKQYSKFTKLRAAVVFGGDLGVAYLGTQGDVWDAHKDMALASLGALIAMTLTAIRIVAIAVIVGFTWRTSSLNIRLGTVW